MADKVRNLHHSWVFLCGDYFETINGSFVGGRIMFKGMLETWRFGDQPIPLFFWRVKTAMDEDDYDLWSCSGDTWLFLKGFFRSYKTKLLDEMFELKQAIKYHPSNAYFKQIKEKYKDQY
jgi:hypothetical protein